ncbi:AsnC family transcriptional regulator [Streptomyces rimosus subsp. pseudoverticillatus]|uniref:Lrp/AsnC family transcriptional regulator n=1 Tax=Streptomyces rimosus TaxID=1927 RepID=UPI0006B26BBD|nr:Lrp/AsnC family transcriptional regulator [Streptomyces rimosus]KOT96171.1 AsnC family transcriptional regulator [Streptomyces rimosus subsp. pseudoverticillatus]
MKTDTVTLDGIDRSVVHALQLDGRVPFRLVGEVLDVSESTVARRYRRLRTAGILRVVGTLDGSRLGHSAWTIRVQCTPDAGNALAKALAARPDTSYVHLLSGGTEISCSAQTPTAEESEALLLHKLPRTARITAVSAHLLLDSYALPNNWAGPASLTPEQVAALTPPSLEEAEVSLVPEDRPLLELLARDGRASHAELAAATGRPESTVRRRLNALRRAGVLAFLVDIPPAALGFRTEARLWLSVQPSQITTVATAMARHPEVSLVALTTGPTNLLAAVNCRDTLHLSRYLTQRIAALDAIRAIETAPVIRTVKRAGPLLLP